MRLRDFRVGDTVRLVGAASNETAFFIGDFQDGRVLLWLNKADRLADRQWACAAAGSHFATEVKNEKQA
jgi:hypothetical protein